MLRDLPVPHGSEPGTSSLPVPTTVESSGSSAGAAASHRTAEAEPSVRGGAVARRLRVWLVSWRRVRRP
jgi:hypothetical protein